jgi:ATP-dependent DNA helicase PIF1
LTREAHGDRFGTFTSGDATYIFTKNDDVAKRNNEVLELQNESVVLIKARHSGLGASSATPDAAQSLMSFGFFARGAKVMLTSNIWIQHQLANGSTGIIRDFLYGENSAPDLPEVIVVEVDGYDGPPFFDEPGRERWVPIRPITATWSESGGRGNGFHQCSRTMFPLRLCYAWTIWKVQGQSIRGPVVIDIGDAELSDGLTYTAITRCTNPKNLCFLRGITKCRLTEAIAKKGRNGRQSAFEARRQEEDRLDQKAAETVRLLGEMSPLEVLKKQHHL